MSAVLIANGLLLTASLALVFGGAATALHGTNLVKRLAGVLSALIGAMLGLAALGAGAATLIAAVVIAFAYCAASAGVFVRVQEAYGSIETSAIDNADQGDEPKEPLP